MLTMIAVLKLMVIGALMLLTLNRAGQPRLRAIRVRSLPRRR